MRVLLIEDEAVVAKSVDAMLTAAGFNVYCTDLGEEGIDLARLYDYDAVLLDLNLADMHGLKVLQKMRLEKVMTPVIVVSGEADVATKVRALSAGADDFVAKPFHREELVARISAVARRSKGHCQSAIRVGKLSVDIERKLVSIDGAAIFLTGKEYQIMELLALRNGAAVTKEMFLNHLYGGIDEEPEVKIIDVFVCKLRKKLTMAAGGVDYIETIWGRGYRLRDSEEEAVQLAA
ncbi:response regulator transcription factor [Sphingosinicella sp. BN140058]|uniref:response regulator transcription factor n=1 Tax=Sphingosinicella sp. BN140058 TaxID=1892855 RepID=UPI00101271E0|nr:response regulator transcription factor [Sphingosinicella sp. BN140058]QAY80373.1 response regulator transcription factor [Sphingosinicella sp. BN140058]